MRPRYCRSKKTGTAGWCVETPYKKGCIEGLYNLPYFENHYRLPCVIMVITIITR